MNGCLIEIPNHEFEMHLTKSSVRLVRNKKVVCTELFTRPDMQFEAVLRIQSRLREIQQRDQEHANTHAPQPPHAA